MTISLPAQDEHFERSEIELMDSLLTQIKPYQSGSPFRDASQTKALPGSK
jgi:hypothetical protein